MLVVLTETYFNKVNIQITQRDDFIQIEKETVNLLLTCHGGKDGDYSFNSTSTLNRAKWLTTCFSLFIIGKISRYQFEWRLCEPP